MGKKVISFELSTRSINQAIKQLEEYEREILRKCDLLRDRVAEELRKEASEGFSGAIVDDLVLGGGRKADVNVSVDSRGSITVVIAEGEDAIWCEFGAGVYHNGSAGSSPHPKGAELNFLIGGYGKGKGKRKAWAFYDDGDLSITRGTPAAMPMYNAVKKVSERIVEIAKEVFA